MKKEKEKITYADFMKQIAVVKERGGRALYERLAAKFAKPASHKTQ